jgi:hypothetical protein
MAAGCFFERFCSNCIIIMLLDLASMFPFPVVAWVKKLDNCSGFGYRFFFSVFDS